MHVLVLCIQAPALFVLKLTIPVVDYSCPRHNWNKHLSIVHCIVTPVFCVFAISDQGKYFYKHLSVVHCIVTPVFCVFAISDQGKYFYALTTRPFIVFALFCLTLILCIYAYSVFCS